MKTLINYMRRISDKFLTRLMIFSVIFILNFISCTEPTSYTSFSVRNESKTTVIIDSYRFFWEYMGKDTVFRINPNKEFYRETGGGIGDQIRYEYPLDFFGDSVFIIFNSKDSVFYTRKTPGTGNILNIENYSKSMKSENWYHLEFVITENDYQNAKKK